MSADAFPCPACDDGPAAYRMLSGGREWYCPACGATGEYPEHGENLPRATLLRQGEAGLTALHAQMDQETARRVRPLAEIPVPDLAAISKDDLRALCHQDAIAPKVGKRVRALLGEDGANA